MLVLVNVTRLTTTNSISLFLSLHVNMYLRPVLVVCAITDLQNPARNFPTQLFIDSQVFTGIDDLSVLHIKDLPHMINYHNSVPNK